MHNGTDWLAPVGAEVRAPIAGVITKIGYPYGDDLSFRYIEIRDQNGCRVRVMYVEPRLGLLVGDNVLAGDVIGNAQDLSKRHGPIMRNHVHVELSCGGQLLDPYDYVDL